MEWWAYMAFFFGGLGVLLLMGLPVAFAFTLINIIGVYVFWGGEIGLSQLILSIDSSISTFVLVPVPMFILMGTVMFHSGVAYKMIDVLDEWMGRIAGRLALLAIGAGALLATLTGVAMGSVAMLGSTLAPEMERRGYAKSMTLGPILASGSLAIMIPPSALAVILASLGKISVGKLLVGIILPGFLLAVVYAAYIVIRCTLKPSIAPPYDVAPTPMGRRILDTFLYVVPLLSVIVVVIGTIFMGIATPTEAAAVGTLLCFLLAKAYGKLSWEVTKRAVRAATSISVMVLIILTGSAAFSQVLAFIGVTSAITNLVIDMDVDPIWILILMQVVLIFLGHVPGADVDYPGHPSRVHAHRHRHGMGSRVVRRHHAPEFGTGDSVAALRAGAVRHERHRLAGHHHGRYLPRRAAFRRAEPPGHGHHDRLSRRGAVAAQPDGALV